MQIPMEKRVGFTKIWAQFQLFGLNSSCLGSIPCVGKGWNENKWASIPPSRVQNHHVEPQEPQGGTQKATGTPREAQGALQTAFLTLFTKISKISNPSIRLILLIPGPFLISGGLWGYVKIGIDSL